MTEKEGCISLRTDGEVGLLLGRLLVGELLGIESQEKTDSWPRHTGPATASNLSALHSSTVLCSRQTNINYKGYVDRVGKRPHAAVDNSVQTYSKKE